ncbi:lantibiotic dehydratase [Rhizorhabdus sp. FW153]|uniref:lantibiotic dehydratase n=1 Tax=Rhizorhabdus sp. FW153 TaxID=3400216 RepID=UPI003CF86649
MRIALSEGWTLWPIGLLRGAGLPFSVFETALGSSENAVRAARMPLFREAVAWQNRRILATALDRLAVDVPLDKKARQSLRVVARYVQRYTAKNDTIGFFGPLGWARLVPEAPGAFVPADALVAARRVSFEPWAVKAIVNACPQARVATPVRLAAHLRQDGDRLIGPEQERALTADELRVLREAVGKPRSAIADTHEGDRALCDQLIDEGVLVADVPVAVAHDPAEKAPPSPLFAHFQTLIGDLAGSAGDAEKVAAAIERIETEFERHTGRGATRAPGQTYAGRTLVYEDCRRGGDLTLGKAALDRVLGVLALMGQVARGYSFSVGQSVCAEMLRIFREQQRACVPLPRFWRLTDPVFEVERPRAVADAANRLAQDWAAAFSAREAISLQDAEAMLAPHLHAPSPGWPGARHHSPDLMWQAESAEHLLTGGGIPILAEFHPGVSTFTTLSVLGLAPDRAALEALWAEDFPEPLISPIPHEIFARSTQDARLAASHVHIDTGHGYVAAGDRSETIRAADLGVVEADGRLWAVSLDGRHRFDLMAVFERRIKLRAAVAFPVGPAGPGPRLTIDGVIVRRACWRAVPPPLPRDRFRPAFREILRSWIRGMGAPERVFVRLPREVKPVLVDIRSDLSLDMLAAMLDGDAVVLSEMVPDGDGLWLADAAGERYTSELRLTLCDPLPYDGARVWRPPAS